MAGNDFSNKAEEFRSALRVHAMENNADVRAVLLKLFEGDSKAQLGVSGAISDSVFNELLNGVRSIRQKFTPNDLQDIYNEALSEFGPNGMIAANLVEYFSRTITKARSLAAQLRKLIAEEYTGGVSDYDQAFDSIANVGSNSVDMDSFIDFTEDVLDLPEGSIQDKDAKELYAFVDRNGDGIVGRDDFVEFMLGQSADAIRRLVPSNDDIIVDVQASTTVAQEVDLKKAGYTQLIPDLTSMPGVSLATHGSFGNGQSLWSWKYKQGTCGGRLRPVVDIRLESFKTSSDLVLLGYTCLTTSIAGQWIWIKRANNSEQAKDGIADLRVTLGKSKVASDKIWSSPGVGWSHVEGNFNKTLFGLGGGDAFLWFRPARTRASNMGLKIGPMNTASRQARLRQAIRIAIRQHVPLSVLPANAQRGAKSVVAGQDSNAGSANFDFAQLFGMYVGTDNTLSLSNWRRLLHDVGACVDRPDDKICYSYVDIDLSGSLHRKEYVSFLVLTEFEIDNVVDDIREKLLQHKHHKSQNILRQSRVLSHIFKHVNASRDKILSQAELGALCSTLQIFLVGEEVAVIMERMDLDKDGRVEEGDFLRFLKMESDALSRRALRIHNAASQLRRWLVRGSDQSSALSLNKSITTQWGELKKRCEKVSGAAFPGYLSAQDLQNVLAHQGVHLSFLEASELALVIAPHRNARIQQPDLESFMKGSCRSIGELVAIVERDTMKGIIDLYRAHRNVVNSDGVTDDVLFRKYADAVDEILQRVLASQHGDIGEQEWAGVKAITNKAIQSTSPAVVAIAQLKAGIEASMGRPPNSPLPNLEEWAILAVLVGSASAEDDIFGVHAKPFVEGFCVYCAGNVGAVEKSEVVSLDAMCTQLRAMIKDEALHLGGGKHADYVSVFHIFDTNGNGSISLQEFSNMLSRLQLIERLSKNQIPQLLKAFDVSNTGAVSYEDFLRFLESSREDEDDDIALDDDDESDSLLLGLGSNTPPAAITGNSECDWLLWFLWRQACRSSHRDPESLIADLETSCKQLAKVDTDSSNNKDYRGLSSETLWRQIGEHRMQGSMTRAQFESGVHFVSLDGRGRNDDPVDFLSLCRYVIRMGRAYNGLVQERRNVDGRKFSHLFASLQKQLIQMDVSRQSDSEPGVSTPEGLSGSYFERVLRRQDSNQDGLLTVPEFKLGLRRMQVRDERQWTKPMIRKLFEETDNRADGLIGIAEFGRVVRGDYSRDVEIRNENLSDDEDDRIFSAQRVTPDSTLQRKVSSILMDLVPLSGQTGSPNAISTHCDAVRSAIYRFFQRFDTESNGLIAEDQFQVFARKSGLQSRLRGGELRKLIGKLRVRGAGRETAVVDYEKLCRMIAPNSDSVPRARADAIMLRLQEAARTSALADRSFMNLCTLADHRMTGYISVDEMLIVIKMMGCALTPSELQMVRDLQSDQNGRGDNQERGQVVSKSSIDYRRFNHLLTTYSPGAFTSTTMFTESKDDVYRVRPQSGALPAYATASGVTRVPPSPNATISLDQMRGVQNSGGAYTPMQVSVDRLSSTGPMTSFGASFRLGTVGRSQLGGLNIGGSVDRMLSALARRIAESALGRAGLAPISAFQRCCEEIDGSNSGRISEAALQSLCDDYGILLTPADFHDVRKRFGSMGGDGRVDYFGLCQTLKSLDATNSVAVSGSSGFVEILKSPFVSRRLRNIRSDGVDMRRVFEDADLERLGTIDSRRFMDIVMRFGLVQTERQLCLAAEEFACLGNRSHINYREFCDALESAENSRRAIDGENVGSSQKFDRSYGRLDRSTVMGSGYDGLRSQNEEGGVAHSRKAAVWNDPLSYRTDSDSETFLSNTMRSSRSNVALGRNALQNDVEDPDMWRCRVCAHAENQVGLSQCDVCDTPKASRRMDDERVCSNCKYSNRADVRSCQMCDLML